MKKADCLILSALVLVLVSVGIRFYIAWDQDWSSIFQNMTAIDWAISIIAIGLIGLWKWKIK